MQFDVHDEAVVETITPCHPIDSSVQADKGMRHAKLMMQRDVAANLWQPFHAANIHTFEARYAGKL